MIEVFLRKPSDAQSTPGMSYFSLKLQKCPILNVPYSRSQISRRKTSMTQCFGILVVLYLDVNLRKNEKSISQFFGNLEIY